MKDEHVSEALLHLYHRLPSPAHFLTANLRGLQLRRLRYGPETEDLITKALERDTWSGLRWNAFRDLSIFSFVLFGMNEGSGCARIEFIFSFGSWCFPRACLVSF